MTKHQNPLTGEQAKARLRRRGMTTTQWAAEHGYNRRDVYRVLNGQLKANFGTAHDIAVGLGMKVPDVDEEPSSLGAARNMQQRRVA